MVDCIDLEVNAVDMVDEPVLNVCAGARALA